MPLIDKSNIDYLDEVKSNQFHETPPYVTELRSPIIISNTGVIPNAPTDFDNHPKSENVFDILRKIRNKNVNKVVFATLNVNSLPNKFDQVKTFIQGNIDILIITESKLNETFPLGQFCIDDFTVPYRLDRNIHGGGVLIYVREDIPSKQLNIHVFPEGIFVEINLRQAKWLLFGSYHPPSQSEQYYFDYVGRALDMYSVNSV